MTWTSVGSVNMGPQDREVLVGSFSMNEGDDTIWFRVTQTSPQEVWRYSFALLTWRTSFGQELGTQKVYGDTNSEVFALGVGLPPLERDGSVIVTPRSYNRAWIQAADPPTWSLSFEAQSGKTVGPGPDPGPDNPTFGTNSTLGSLADPSEVGITYAFIQVPLINE